MSERLFRKESKCGGSRCKRNCHAELITKIPSGEEERTAIIANKVGVNERNREMKSTLIELKVIPAMYVT